MKGKALLEQLLPTLLRVGPSEKNIELYKEVQESLKDFEIVDVFHQLKRNDRGDGLAFEIMMFNDQQIYDLVVTPMTIDLITVLVKNLNMCYIETSYGPTTNEKGVIVLTDMLRFTISYGGDSRTLMYSTEVKRFTEINRIKNNLLNLCKK